VYELGMVSQVVDPPEELREQAQALAESIADHEPAELARRKRVLWQALEMGLSASYRNAVNREMDAG
jgi:enoyl-CoA hydratase